ncbi:hypothetical protein QQF64_022349 [Cirrhinus molitorella]|uniref:BED-type domain-containing protein n=1 Tax=Cirrhinus molitorella TaxID=172907 RepID=A0ABR3LAA2_9TELE
MSASSSIIQFGFKNHKEFVEGALKRRKHKATCKFCDKTILETCGTTSNFIRHLQRNHKARLQEYRASQSRGNSQTIIDLFQRQTSQVQVYSASSSRQLAINQAIIQDLIIGCCLPLSIVENQHFRHFLHIIDERYIPIARSTITSKHIPQLVTRVKECIKSSLADQKFVSVTADIWSDRTLRSYLGVTAHVCNCTANEYTLKSFLLDCRRFKGHHNAENIVAAFDEILEEYNISDKVEFIITDNASNMKKAFKFAMTEDHSDDSEDEEDMVGEPLDRNVHLGSRQRLSCFAHSLQLVVGDGLKEVKCLSQAISKVSKLATLLHSSTIFKDKFEAVFGNGKSIPAASVTRWNSTFRQIQAVTELGHTALTEMCSFDFKNIVITTREWAQLRELCLILGPFAEATELTEGEKMITISMVVPTVLDLNTHLIQMDSSKSLCRPLIRALQESLQQRFSGIFIALHMTEPEDHSFDAPFSHEFYAQAAILDPQFGMSWVDMDVRTSGNTVAIRRLREEVRKSLTDSLIAEAEKADLENIHAREGSKAEPPQDSPPDSKIPRLLAKYRTHKKKHSTPTEASIVTQVMKYLEDIQSSPAEVDPLMFWFHNKDKYPHLHALALKVLSVPASSAPVERVFSAGGLLMRPHRARLGPTMLSSLIFLKCNNGLL